MGLVQKGVADLLRPTIVTMQGAYSSLFTVWEDQTFPFAGREIDRVAGRLSFDFAQGGIVFPANSRYQDEDSIWMVHQLLHAWKLGSSVYPHIHWYPVADPFVAGNMPNWLLRRKINPNAGAPSAWEYLQILETVPASGYTWTLGDLVVSRFPPIDMSLYADDTSLSALLDYQLWRDVSNTSTKFTAAETAPVDVTIKTFDSHIEKDTLGSFLQWAKFGA